MEEAESQCKSQEVVIEMGDLNAKVWGGQDNENNLVGKHGPGIRTERGERWVQWCTAIGQVITNACFKEHPRRHGGAQKEIKRTNRLCDNQQKISEFSATL